MVEAAPQARPKTTPRARIVVEVCLLVPFKFGHCLDHLGWWWALVGQCFCNVCLLNALPVPMLRQVFLDLQNRAPMQVKLTFLEIDRFFRFFVFFKIDVLPAWELIFRVFSCFFEVFSFFVFWGAPQK